MRGRRDLRLATIVLVTAFASTAFALGPRDVDALPASTPTATIAYGDGALQFGELRLPEGTGPFPLAIVIHGGCWTKGFATSRNTAPIATALVKRGIATWNVEYRQAGDDGGGWPGTFRDWSAATDYVRVLAKTYPIDLDRVVVTGHSAGAHAALWIAARPRLPADSELRTADALKVRGAIAIDGPGDPAGFVGLDARICGKPVMVPFMGATPDADPGRYRQASPQDLLPLGMPQVLVAARVLLPDAAREYATLADAKGDATEIIELATGHFEPIAPGEDAWTRVEASIVRLATAADGLVQRRSPHGAKETMDRFASLAKARGLTVFARVDHAEGAAGVDLPLRPTEVLVFGHPRGGTPLMQCAQTIGIDLPLKALVWEDATGQVWLGYDDPAYLAKRHGAASCPAVAPLRQALAGLATATVAPIAR